MQKLRRSLSKRSLSFTSSSSSLKSGSIERPLSIERPISPPPPQITQTYFHIPLGSGGMIGRANHDGPLYAGATGTVNTVGVFFEVGDSLCFLAHINAYTTRPSSSDPTKQHYTANFQTAAKIRAAVLQRLDGELSGAKTRRMRDTLVITCARLSGQGPTVAEIVAKAVREWLETGAAGGGRVAAVGTSFIAGWPAAANLVFQEDPGEHWVPVECGFGRDTWIIGFEEEELEGSDEPW